MEQNQPLAPMYKENVLFYSCNLSDGVCTERIVEISCAFSGQIYTAYIVDGRTSPITLEEWYKQKQDADQGGA